MKTLAAILLLLAAPVLAYEIRVDDGHIVVNKWTINGAPVFTQSEKDYIIANSTAQASDFIACDATQTDLDIMAEIEQDGKFGTRASVLKELQKRKTRAYNIKKIRDLRNDIFMDLQLRAENGTDVSASTTATKALIETYKARALAGN